MNSSVPLFYFERHWWLCPHPWHGLAFDPCALFPAPPVMTLPPCPIADNENAGVGIIFRCRCPQPRLASLYSSHALVFLQREITHTNDRTIGRKKGSEKEKKEKKEEEEKEKEAVDEDAGDEEAKEEGIGKRSSMRETRKPRLSLVSRSSTWKKGKWMLRHDDQCMEMNK